jgi:hypothetical protein
MSVELAAAAVGFLVPYLTEAGKEAAKTVGKETAGAGIKLLGWLREKLTGRAKEALEDLETQPASADNQADLRKQLAKLLEQQPDLAEQLRALLSEAPPQGSSIHQTVGAGAQAIQNVGNQNTGSITVSKP